VSCSLVALAFIHSANSPKELANGTSRTKHCGPVFEVKADWNNAQKWTAFALWVNDLVQNPDKFYHG